MSFLSTREACDMREVISGVGLGYEHRFVGLRIVGCLGTWRELVLTLVFIYEARDDVVDGIIAIGGCIKRDQK